MRQLSDRGLVSIPREDGLRSCHHAGTGHAIVAGSAAPTTASMPMPQGAFYARSMADEGTDFVTPPVPGGERPTSRSVIFACPGGERSMNTCLGIASELGPGDGCGSVAGRAGSRFLEGYLSDGAKGRQAFARAVDPCHKAGGKAAIALCDPFRVDRHRADVGRLVRSLDHVIGNGQERCALCQARLSGAPEQAVADAGLVLCTRSGRDVIAVAAGEVIRHFGARPETDLKALFRQDGLIRPSAQDGQSCPSRLPARPQPATQSAIVRAMPCNSAP